MIVTTSKIGFHIIYHEAHGLLAGKIGSYIDREILPNYWFETLIAITEHDDRQLNFKEKNYLSDINTPLDFTDETDSIAEIKSRIDRIIKSTTSKSLWIRLLISYHLEFLYLEKS